MRVLIIGGSGFVGSALVPRLKLEGLDLTLLNRGSRPNPRVKQLIADRNDPAALAAASTEFDAVIDTSSYSGEQTRLAFETFGGQTGRWIHLSSAAVYRSPEGALPTEADRIGGADVWAEYGRDKSDADQYLLAQSQTPVAIIRPPYLYGPNNDLDREKFIWSRVLTSRPVIVPGKGDAVIQFLYVDDLADLFAHLLKSQLKGQQVYNAAHAETFSLLDWVREVAEVAQTKTAIYFGDDVAPGLQARAYFPFRDTQCALSVSAASDELGWQAGHSIRKGLKKTFRTYSPVALSSSSPSTEAEQSIVLSIN
jgi:nucleoside-diphosphate-sugar epimerase